MTKSRGYSDESEYEDFTEFGSETEDEAHVYFDELQPVTILNTLLTNLPVKRKLLINTVAFSDRERQLIIMPCRAGHVHLALSTHAEAASVLHGIMIAYAVLLEMSDYKAKDPTLRGGVSQTAIGDHLEAVVRVCKQRMASYMDDFEKIVRFDLLMENWEVLLGNVYSHKFVPLRKALVTPAPEEKARVTVDLAGDDFTEKVVEDARLKLHVEEALHKQSMLRAVMGYTIGKGPGAHNGGVN